MPWLALTLEVDAASAEALSEALLEAGAQSVALEEAAGGPPRQQLTALLEPRAAAQAVVESAALAAGISAPRFSASRLEDRDWVRQSQAQFAPIAFGKRLWIGPSWHTPPADAAAAVRLDPGLAFGTGSHATTRLVLRFLAESVHGGERLLDYGCGSGILAIAAAKLGAARVDAVDIDPQALETTAANAGANGVALRCMLPEALAPARYDIVVSNILAQPLIVLAPLLAARSARGGRIALSGVLDSQADEVAGAYAGYFELECGGGEDGWALLEGIRR